MKFDLDQTVVQLGLEDKTPFIEPEQHATLQQLLMSRYDLVVVHKVNIDVDPHGTSPSRPT